MKVGAIRYRATIDDETGKIEFLELILRSKSFRKRFNGFNWHTPVEVCFWIVKVKDLTWVKRSKSHGDWGWAKSIPNWLRDSRIVSHKQPGSPTKKGALRTLLADTRRCLKDYGDTDPDYPDEMPYTEQIKRIQRAIKRMK